MCHKKNKEQRKYFLLHRLAIRILTTNKYRQSVSNLPQNHGFPHIYIIVKLVPTFLVLVHPYMDYKTWLFSFFSLLPQQSDNGAYHKCK